MAGFPPQDKAKGSFIVRVRIENDQEKVYLSSKGRSDIIDAATGKALEAGVSFGRQVAVSAIDRGVQIGRKYYGGDFIRVVPEKGIININGRNYRGVLDIIPSDKKIDVINRVELEDYLKGVLPCEVSQLWPSAALKAQAIVSRSFAVSQALRRKSKQYDLTDDTFSQVYGGKDFERWRTTRAVDETRGKVLAFQGKVLPAYFHSCCGGHTEDAGSLWNEDMPPLTGVKCPWCRWSPRFRWHNRIHTDVILEKLRAYGCDIKKIEDIRPGVRNKSDRLEYVKIKAGDGWFNLSSSDFIQAVGPRKIRSANMRVAKYPFFYYFSGYGWGHGVGMCQWGAFYLALRWWSADRILNYYYPGTHVVNLIDLVKGK